MLEVYKASAGSGKTFRLAQQYISLLLGSKDADGRYRLNRPGTKTHRHILAITFTNKATEEMKSRIVHELALLADMEPSWLKEGKTSKYAADLCALYGCTPAELKNAATAALKTLLFDFNFFHVNTIDAFFQVILRTFAREAELNGTYSIELDNRAMVAEGVSRLLNSLTEDPEGTRRLSDYITTDMSNRVKNGTGANIFDRKGQLYSTLLKQFSNLFAEKVALNMERMNEYFSDPTLFQDFIKAIADRRKAIAAQITVLEDTAKKEINDCMKALSADRKAADDIHSNVIKALNKEAAGIISNSTYFVKYAANNNASLDFKKNTAPHPAFENALLEASKAIVARNEQIAHLECEIVLLKSISKNNLTLALMKTLLEHIAEYRAENNALLLSDTGSLLSSLLGEGDTPFVYERMGVWLSNFLIDEFQDTSAMQWKILHPLVKEGLANGNDSLIIGDEKQCIYRFRNSDPTLLGSQVDKDFTGLTEITQTNANTNWRSSKDVVEFNNALFHAMAARNGIAEIYANVRQTVAPKHKNHAGYIHVRLVDADKEEFAETVLANLTADINRQLAAGYKPSDIVVLARGKTEAKWVVETLQADGHEVISDDAMMLAISPAVKIIVNGLRAYSNSLRTVNPDDKTARISNLIADFESGIIDGIDPNTALTRAINATAAPEFSAPDEISSWSLPLLVEDIITRSLPEDERRRQHLYISAFCDVVTDFCEKNTADVDGFLRWWDINASELKVSVPEDKQSIRVMTIHKAKGLEFPCVHIPFGKWEAVKFIDPEWVDMDGIALDGIDSRLVPPLLLVDFSQAIADTPLADTYRRRVDEQTLDEINVLYVAFTRAKDELSVQVAKPGSAVTAQSLIVNALSSAFPGQLLSADNDFICGSPTTPTPEEKDPPTAIEPTAIDSMPDFFSCNRPEIWDDIKLSTDDK